MLNKINNPKDLKKLNINDLIYLSKEIRDFLINSISETGGHLSPNLGVVELTIAMHYCFDSPKDKIIWDVGHQSYTHKILTGRKNDFNTLRKYKGLSGFPKPEESIHDIFGVGHSSTSISAGLGFALSRDLKNEKYNVISIIGDGSMTGGLAFEALNDAGQSDTKFIVVLNDNEMSISKNVGAMSRHLNKIRTAPSYLGAKKDVNYLLKNVPGIGEKIGKFIEKTKDGIKYFFISGILFEEFGFKYIGPIDGHDIQELIRVFNMVKKMDGPILLHVYTKKGKGYHIAEKHPERFHGIDPFDIKTGKNKKSVDKNTYSNSFGKKLAELGKLNKNIVAITASMSSGTGLTKFQNAYPSRVFDVGIAESHAVTFGAGMAKNGMIPVFAVYSSFLQRGFDQIVHDVCIQKLPVIFAIDRAGIVGSDGETHQGVFDLSYLSIIPNMTILAPRNCWELEEMLEFAIKFGSPVAIRYPKGSDSKVLSNRKEKIIISKSEIINEGHEIAILSVGTMMDYCYNVYLHLVEDGYNPTLVNVRFIKEMDNELISSLKKYRVVFVIEDNIKKGGFGSNLLIELSNQNNTSTIVKLLSFPDEFIEQGSREELFKQYNLDSNGIYNCIKSNL